MPESETESESSGSGSRRSSYSSESYSDNNAELQPRKKDAQQNKGTMYGLYNFNKAD